LQQPACYAEDNMKTFGFGQKAGQIVQTAT